MFQEELLCYCNMHCNNNNSSVSLNNTKCRYFPSCLYPNYEIYFVLFIIHFNKQSHRSSLVCLVLFCVCHIFKYLTLNKMENSCMVYIDIRFLFWDSLQTIHETVSPKTKLKNYQTATINITFNRSFHFYFYGYLLYFFTSIRQVSAAATLIWLILWLSKEQWGRWQGLSSGSDTSIASGGAVWNHTSEFRKMNALIIQ